jgi:branched-chain amino acid transport system permease protein
LSFAGIGAVAYAHLGLDSPLALLWAALWAGAVGALVALPAIRLAGIYLALATGAVAVMLDQWIFVLPNLSIFGHDFFLFNGGSLPVRRPSVAGLGLDGSRAYFVYSAVVFALLTLLVVAVRRSPFGQRLVAVKEAPAAATTVGIDVARTKLAVFTLSAAIAGVGGAIIVGSQQSATQEGFSFFAGLPILLVMVVGGAALPGSAVLTGVFLSGGAVLALSPLGATTSTGSGAIVRSIIIGGVALALARNPNGIVTALRRAFLPVAAERPVLVGLGAALSAAWGLRFAGLVNDAAFGWAVTAAVVAAPVAAALLRSRRAPDGRPAPRSASGGRAEDLLGAPPELLGLTAPFRDEDLAVLDAIAGVPVGHRSGGATAGPIGAVPGV